MCIASSRAEDPREEQRPCAFCGAAGPASDMQCDCCGRSQPFCIATGDCLDSSNSDSPKQSLSPFSTDSGTMPNHFLSIHALSWHLRLA